MGLAAWAVRRRRWDGPWTPRGGAWMGFASTSRHTTGVAQTNTGIDHLSTNGASYPQVRTPYPHLSHRRGGPPRPLGTRIFSDRAGHRSIVGACPHAPSGTPSRRVGVERLAEGADVATEIVVLGHLPLDLFAAVEHGRVVPAAERLADPKQRCLG